MELTFDKFPSNILEMQGRINRQSFNFKYDYVEVWKGGQCIFKRQTDGYIQAHCGNSRMTMKVDNSEINNYIEKEFHFDEISTNLDRILWSKDLLDNKGVVPLYNNPDISSLFFNNKRLAKITFTIHNPNILVEFYTSTPQVLLTTPYSSNRAEKISHIRNLLGIAGSDGNFDEGEKELIFDIAAKAGLTPAEMQTIFNNPEEIDFVVPKEEEERYKQLEELILLMISDGEITPVENSLVSFFAIQFGFDNRVVQDIIESIYDELENANSNFDKGGTGSLDLSDFKFLSSDHCRYENGRLVGGPHGGAPRGIKIEDNITGGEGYTVTMYNMDGKPNFWGNNVQMAPKQMEIVSETDNKIVLRGFGYDNFGNSFSDYGLSINLISGEVDQITLHLHDRNVQIVYLQ